MSKRCEYYRAVDSTKQEYHRNRIDSAGTNGLFKIVDELTGSRKANAHVKPTNIPESDLADAFLRFFHDKVNNLRVGLTPVADNSERRAQSDVSEFSPVTTNEIINLVNHSSSKSCELDILPTHLVKNCIIELAPFLVHLFNVSFTSGIVPQAFKSAAIRPLLKKSGLDCNILKNYRPVSNVPFLSKCLERIVISQLNDYLLQFDLYAKCQSAYRSNHSCETALVRVHNDIMLALNDKNDVILVLLDLSAAFDTLDLNVLLRRLEHRFGIKGSVLDWFKSYLCNRTQFVRTDSSHTSQESSVDCGVPQGTVCGPTLFTLYTAPLEDIIIKHGLDYMLFADDTQLYFVCKKPSTVQNAIEACIEEIRLWMASNLLVLNDDKTEVIQFSSRFRKDGEKLVSLGVGGLDITPSESVRNLGVFFDNDGGMSSHINHVCKTAYHSLFRIGKIRSLLSQSSTEKLVHAFITSRLDYCNSLFIGLPEKDIKKLQSIQNSAAKLVTRSKKFDHVQPILHDLHWLKVEHRIEFKILLLTFKILQGNCPVYLRELISVYTPGKRGLRSANHLELRRRDSKRTNCTYGQRAFSIAAPRLWNDLPIFIRVSENVETFKRNLKTHLFRKQFNLM